MLTGTSAGSLNLTRRIADNPHVPSVRHHLPINKGPLHADRLAQMRLGFAYLRRFDTEPSQLANDEQTDQIAKCVIRSTCDMARCRV